MKAKVGLYFFCMKRGYFAIYQYTSLNVDTGITTASHINDTYCYEDAVSRVYALNGWSSPKNVKLKF